MEEIKSVRVRTSDSNDIKVTLYDIGRNKRKVNGVSGGLSIGTTEYKGNRYKDYSDEAIIDDYLRVLERGGNKLPGFYEIIQDPWEEEVPSFINYGYGVDPYYLNNGSRVVITWTTGKLSGSQVDEDGDSCYFGKWLGPFSVIGGKEWSDKDGNELPLPSGVSPTQSYYSDGSVGDGNGTLTHHNIKERIVKSITIWSPEGEEESSIRITDESILSLSSNVGYKTTYDNEGKSTTTKLDKQEKKYSGNIDDIDIVNDIISAWNKKVPNYDVGLCEPSNEFCNVLEYKSPIKLAEEEETVIESEEVPVEEPIDNRFTFNVEKEGVFIPISAGTSSTTDSKIGELTIVEPGGFVFQDDFDQLDELDPEFMESEFAGEEEVNAITDEPDPSTLNDTQENPTPTSVVTGAPLSGSKLLQSAKSGRFYVLSSSNGVAGHRLKNIITDLAKYLNANGFPGTKLKSNGVMRDLEKAAITTNPKRAVGSLHGAGLAIDLKFDIPGKSWSGIGDNGNLSKDPKLNKAIMKWVKSQGDLTWGGQWGKSKPQNGMVQGWGITEYHHFEIKASKISPYWKPFESDLAAMGLDYKKLNSTKKLLKLYLKLLGKENYYCDISSDHKHCNKS